MNPVGLYIHIPYCLQKCNYCDFYSLADPKTAGEYGFCVQGALSRLATRYPRRADTVYLGGGTPTMMPPGVLASVLDTARKQFRFVGGEITCEINPGEGYPTRVEDLAAMGVNRLSVGLQSAVPEELAVLGRRHTPLQVKQCVQQAKASGITNCSVDLMWGIPGQTVESALKSVEFALSLDPAHISAYLLKIEENTPFGKHPPVLPPDDTVCDIYEGCCERLEQAGFPRYEISNFARPGFESRHNLKYWNCEETLGIGPAAHSFMEGKRFYYPRDLAGFMADDAPVDDGAGGDFTEYAMLQLRLATGLQEAACHRRFGYGIPHELLRKAKPMVEHGLMTWDGNALALTVKGNLVSNEILAVIL